MKVLSWNRLATFAITASFSLIALSGGAARAALLYSQNFDNFPPTTTTVATPGVTPGGGLLGIAGTAAFSSSGGVFGGSLNASGNNNNTTTGTGVAATSVGSGSTIGGVGTLNQFTVTFWFNPSTVRTGGGSSIQHRLLTFGDSTTTDVPGGAAAGFWLRNNTSGTTNPFTLDVFVKGRTVTPLDGVGNATGIAGTESPIGTWTFVALTYDASSSFGNDSAIQSVATGGASMVNGQLYHGTNTTAVTRFDAPITVATGTSSGDPTAASSGPIDFGAAAQLLLANRSAGARAFDGFMDDVRIYDSVLSAAEVEGVRRQGLVGAIPEPSTSVLAAICGLGALRFRRRR
jgi:hypothetical protein